MVVVNQGIMNQVVKENKFEFLKVCKFLTNSMFHFEKWSKF